MQPQLIVIDTPQAIIDLQKYLEPFEYIAYDCETTGLTRKDEIIGFSVCAEEDKAFYVIMGKWVNDRLAYQSGSAILVPNLIESLIGKKLIMHNGGFDCAMAESYFKINLIESLHTDTMLLAHLLNENRKVGLKELAKEYFGEDSTLEQTEMKASVLANGGQLTKDNYELYKADSQLLGKYGAKDALLTYKLFLKLVPELYEQKLDQFFYEDESMPMLRTVTYELNTTGLLVDQKRMTALKKQLEAECLEIKAYIDQEILAYIKDKYPGTTKKNIFNIGSNAQLSWLLFGQMNLEFNTLTDSGKDVARFLNIKPYTYKAKRDFIEMCKQAAGSTYIGASVVNGKKKAAKKVKEPWSYIACDKEALQKLSPKHKWIEKLLEYQGKQKLLNTYIEGVESRLQYGIVLSSYLQHGTTSGRLASRNPNLQNLPRNDQRIKECFISRPGKVFVSADFSQLEPRTFSYYSQDPRLMAAFDGTSDFYSVVGIPVFGITDATPQKEGSPNAFGVKYKRLRDDAKVFALARAYGATARQLAPMLKKSPEDTQLLLENYDEEFPGVDKMKTDAHELAKKNGYVTSLFGRLRRIPDALKINKLYGKTKHEELPYEARSLLNLAVNHRIQSTGASICNRAAIRFLQDCKTANIEVKLVSQVHDELIAECLEADSSNVAILLQNAMENTVTLEGVSLEAIPRITKNLAK